MDEMCELERAYEVTEEDTDPQTGWADEEFGVITVVGYG